HIFLLFYIYVALFFFFKLLGPSGPLVVPLGGSVLLPCSVDSLSSLEDLEVQWKRSDSEILIHLYHDGDIRPEVQHEDFFGRAHFFTENIKHGNFSLLMKNVTSEDEGQYTCTVHSGHESGETVVEIKDVGEWFTVKGPSGPLVVPLGGSVLLPCSVESLSSLEDLEVEWKRSDSQTLIHLYQDGDIRPEAQHEDYHDRAHFFTENIKQGNFSLLMKNVTAEDEGQYTCTVHNRSISVYVGEDVTLNCSVDSHIPPEHFEEVSWKKTDKDEHITVLLYQNNYIFPDASDELYRDRVEFFSDEIHRGNFSLRLKRVRTEDKGLYMCHVFAGRFSDNTTVILQQLGLSGFQIMVLILCISACGSALLFCSLIYCRNNTVWPTMTISSSSLQTTLQWSDSSPRVTRQLTEKRSLLTSGSIALTQPPFISMASVWRG
ncbi:hypothetical protein IRJ41_020627, partial [Triplophysa rosa]